MNELDAIVDSAKAAFAQAGTPADLENAKARFLGKAGRITELMKGMAALAVDEKKSRGAAINLAKQAIEAALTSAARHWPTPNCKPSCRPRRWMCPCPAASAGRAACTRCRSRWSASRPSSAPWVLRWRRARRSRSDWFNFTALNTPEDHPARSMHDTFYVEGGSEKAPNLLRTHTSPMQIRHAVQHVKKHAPRAGLRRDWARPMPEIRVIAPGRTYRVDSDATHSPMFHQCEGLWIGENVSFKDLKFVFTDFCRAFFESDDLVLRFRPSFFPFTEPSAEIDIQFQQGPLAGRWLEVAGSGQVHPNVVRNMGLDPEQYIGFAFGMGPDRLTMLRYGVNDLRLFFDGDIRFLCQFQ